MALDFGFYPRPYDKKISSITISTLPGLEVTIEAVTSSEYHKQGWFVVPGRSRVFALPKTHQLTYARPTSDEHLQFLVWCFGFFVGMRMSWTEAGFLDATTVRESTMSDIVWLDDSLEKAIEGSDAFWHKYASNPRIAKILTGVIHAYFLAQTRGLLQFEEFIYLYTAFDGCHAVRETISGRIPHLTRHGDRIRNLCLAFGTVADSAGSLVPVWADSPGNAQPAVTAVRNNALHEGLFFDEPLGFQGFGGGSLNKNVIGDMTALLGRFIIALLELPANDYIRSPITARAMEGVRL